MFRNEFVGENAAMQSVKVLILGESHYESETKIDGTADVVKYLAVQGKDNRTQFYKNIMRAFGYDPTPEQRKLFWNKVYCGNYVSDLCGIRGNNTAAKRIKTNRKRYNDELFSFINDKGIDVVFCFSRLVYRNLPSAAAGEKEDSLIESATNRLTRFQYNAGIEHGDCGVLLKKPLTVYGLKHPSAGFSPAVYSSFLSMEIF